MNSLRYYNTKYYQLPHLLRRSYSSGLPIAQDVVETEESTEPERTINTNKSGLLPQHRNMLHGRRPYRDAQSWIHQTEKYQRKVFGQYGTNSNVDPRICFPQETVAKSLEKRQRIAEPKTIQDMLNQLEEEDRLKKEAVLKREQEISKNMLKLDVWTQELHNKIKKKEADALAAKEKKERLIEEVRRHFGYKVDPRDERFKEMLEQKDKEQRKKDKEAKRQAKETKMLTKLTSKTSE